MKNRALFLKGILFASSFFILSQCKSLPAESDANEKTFIVASQTADCTGVAPMKCLQIKEKKSENWQNLYSNIEGFTYEPGFEYTLKVRTEKVENPPADASSIKYVLVKEISKVKK